MFLVVGVALLGMVSGAYLYHSYGARHGSESTGIGDFTLLDQTGAARRLYSYSSAKAVVIVGHGNSCPILQKFIIRLNELNAKYAPKGVVFLMINPNEEDTRESVAAEATEYNLQLPIMLDPSQIVTQRLGLTRTADTVILNPKTWEIVYHGAINDRLSYGADKFAARHEFLAMALDDILGGHRIHFQPDPAKGCAYSFYRSQGLDYTGNIAPILEAKCLHCHSEDGQTKPYLNSFESVQSFSAVIKKTLFAGRMPPDNHGDSSSNPDLSPEEKHDLVAWIDQGCPRGIGIDPLAHYASPQ